MAFDNAVATICPLSLIAIAELRWYVSAAVPISLLRSVIAALGPDKRDLPNGTCPGLDRRIGVRVNGWEISITYYQSELLTPKATLWSSSLLELGANDPRSFMPVPSNQNA